jgi:hypothetical protein
MMEYKISSLKDSVLIKVLGPLNRNAIYSVSTFIKPFLKGASTKITLDVDGLEDEKEMVFHLGLINAFKKEIDQAGGKLTVMADRASIKKYLKATRLNKLFNISDPQFAIE